MYIKMIISLNIHLIEWFLECLPGKATTIAR